MIRSFEYSCKLCAYIGKLIASHAQCCHAHVVCQYKVVGGLRSLDTLAKAENPTHFI